MLKWEAFKISPYQVQAGIDSTRMADCYLVRAGSTDLVRAGSTGAVRAGSTENWEKSSSAISSSLEDSLGEDSLSWSSESESTISKYDSDSIWKNKIRVFAVVE